MFARLEVTFPLRVRATLVLLLLVGLAGCGGGHSASGAFAPSGQTAAPSTAPPAPASSTTPGGPTALPAPGTMTTPELKQSVLTAYKAYMKAYELAYSTNNAGPLGDVAVDPVLKRVTDDLQANAAKGVLWRFHNVLSPVVQGWANDKSKVLVLDCVENLGMYEYRLSNGSRVTTKKPVNYYYQAQMAYVQGVWKMTDDKVGNRC